MVEKRPKTSEQSVPSAHHIIIDNESDAKRVHRDQQQDLLAARLRNGDRSAAIELVDLYYEQIYLFLRRLGHDEQTSEDLTQESFLNAWYHIGQLRNGSALTSWLYRIAANVSNLHWRKNRGREVRKIENLEVPDDTDPELDRLGHDEDLSRLKIIVDQLPAKLQRVIVLHYMQHLTIAEAAGAMGIREGTFKSRLNRALKAIKKQMMKSGEQQ